MKKLGEKLNEIVKREAETFDLFLVHHTVSPTGLFRFYIDSEGPLDMKVLADFTRHVSQLIDEGDFGDKAFTFEISSPGAENPLRDVRQFKKHVGRNFEVQTAEETFKGKLEKMENDTYYFQCEVKEKGKKPTFIEKTVSFSELICATIIISFK